MAEKTLKTRIVLKHDTSANWELVPNFTPKVAEPIVYKMENGETRMKIGDGTAPVSTLPFLVEPLTNAEIDNAIAPSV